MIRLSWAIAATVLFAVPVPSPAQVLDEIYELLPTSRDEFGSALAVVGDILAVSADQAYDSSGEVHLYDLATGAHLLQIDAPPGDRWGFGEALAGANGLLAVGSSGEVQVFDVVRGSPTFGVLVRTLAPPRYEEEFGAALAMAGGFLVVGGGTAGPVSAGGPFQDSFVYVYDPATGALVRTFDGGVGGDDFGGAVAGSGNLVAIGASQTIVDGCTSSKKSGLLVRDTSGALGRSCGV